MRTAKTAPVAAGTCCRCTALLTSDVSHCSLCGWPAGVSYPPIDGGQLAPAADDEAAAGREPADSQLAALSGIVERRELAAEEPGLPHATPAEVSTSGPEGRGDAVSADDAVVVPEEPDPLTAPLEMLVHSSEAYGESEQARAVVDETLPAPRRTFGVGLLAQALIGAAALSHLVVAATETIAAGTSALLVLALISLGIWTSAFIAFLHWVARTYSHVASTSLVQQRHGAAMAVAGWMIPVVGVVVGYRVLQDLWTASDPETRTNPSAPPAKVRLIDIWVLGLVTAALFGFVLPVALGGSALWGTLSAVGVVTAALALIAIIGMLGSWSSEPTTPTIVEPVQSIDEGTVTVRVDEVEPSLPEEDQTQLAPYRG